MIATTRRPRKTLLTWAYQMSVTDAVPEDLARALLDRHLALQLATLNKRGPRWAVRDTRVDRMPAADLGGMRGYGLARIVAHFVAVAP